MAMKAEDFGVDNIANQLCRECSSPEEAVDAYVPLLAGMTEAQLRQEISGPMHNYFVTRMRLAVLLKEKGVYEKRPVVRLVGGETVVDDRINPYVELMDEQLCIEPGRFVLYRNATAADFRTRAEYLEKKAAGHIASATHCRDLADYLDEHHAATLGQLFG